MSDIDWKDISQQLRAPFAPEAVDFRVQGNAGANGRAQVVAYIDARSVQDRLDAVVGAGAWSFDWTPLIMEKGDVQVAKGTITIHGVSKSDAGTASNFEQSLGAVSHCFKRAAVMWGIGRYLYDLPATWIAVEGKGRIPDQTLATLRANLPRPDGSQPTPARATATPATASRPAAPTATRAPQRTPAPSQRAAQRPTDGPADEAVVVTQPTEQQATAIARLSAKLQHPSPVFHTYTEASRIITDLTAKVNAQRAATTAGDHDLHEAFPAESMRGA